jgi:hypothetical protein
MADNNNNANDNPLERIQPNLLRQQGKRANSLEDRIQEFPGPLPGQYNFNDKLFSTLSKEKAETVLKTGSSATPVKLIGIADRIYEALFDLFSNQTIFIQDDTPPLTTTPDFPTFRTELETLFKDTGAVISGGFILKILGNFRKIPGAYQNSDIDCYVNCRNLKQFSGAFCRRILGYIPRMVERKSSTYCSSFLRRNGIRTVQTFSGFTTTGYKERSIDVMAVRNSRSPIDVCKNFDLTFCQLWFDGTDVWATHPEHIQHKIGYLQGGYVPLYLAGNVFLMSRTKKYSDRGFQIFLDPTQFQSLQDLRIGSINPYSVQLSNPAHAQCMRIPQQQRTPVWYKDYAIRTILEYILTNEYHSPGSMRFQDLEPSFITRGNISPEELNDVRDRDAYLPTGARKNDMWKLTDGYDSEDYGALPDLRPTWDDEIKLTTPLTFEGLYEIAKEKAALHGRDPALAALDPKSAFMNLASAFFQLFWSPDGDTNPFHFPPPQDEEPYGNVKYGPFLERLRDAIFEEGESALFGTEGQLYTFHAHKYPDYAITRESLEEYLRESMDVENKQTVRCFARPDCDKPLLPEEIRPFVSFEFYREYMKPKTGPTTVRNTAFAIADVIMTNEQDMDRTYGMISHYAFCPFCLLLDERVKGCAYLHHKNDAHLPDNSSPFCQESLIVEEVRRKYEDVMLNNDAILPGIPAPLRTLEFCVECGRPSLNHNHFSLEDPNLLVPHQINPQDNMQAYGLCDGGGRPELFARLLAVRKTIMDNPDIKDDKELRKRCALAADVAPLNEDLMRQGRELFAIKANERRMPNQNAVNAFIREYPEEAAAANRNENENQNENNASVWSGDNENERAQNNQQAGPPNNLPNLERNNQAGGRQHKTKKRFNRALPRAVSHRRREKKKSTK